MVKIKNLILVFLVLVGGVSSSVAQDLAFDKDDYRKALWMTARFYGAQRMGDGVNWLVADHEPNQVQNGMGFNASKFVKGKSYLKDADGSYDLTGGWFDCGDFVLFGQTFFYSAYMLILGYSEFPEGYDDFYSFDYNGYVSSGDYTWEGKKGVPNGIPDILDEVKYATDFIMKAVRDENTFYYQKGDGDLDHKVWCTSTVKSALSRDQGGEAEGSRAIYAAKSNATTMASLAGATLAAMARLYKPFDPDYAAKCLEKALVAFSYVNNGQNKGHITSAPFYGGVVNYVPCIVLLNAELYRATGDKKYIAEAEKYCTWMDKKSDYNYNYTLCYEHVEDLAAYLMATLGDASSYGEKAKDVFTFYADEMYKPTSGYILNKQSVDGWGAMRYLANQAFTLGLYAKFSGQKEVNSYALKTIEFVLGENPSKQSFVVGFGKKFPHVPHHRNFYRYDGNVMAQAPIPNDNYKFIQLGFLAGGNGTSIQTGVYTESLENYQESEGGIDYNAGLVGALGYINSVINPVNTSKFGHPTPEFEKTISICGVESLTLDTKVPADGKKKFTWYKDGQQVESSTSASTLNVTEEGEYTCEIDSAGEWTTSGTTLVMAIMPSLDVETNYELCNPASVLLDFDMSPIPCSYEWSVDGEVIKDAKTSSYEVTKPGTYKLTISAANCPNTGAEFYVTSLLPTVEDAVSDEKGNVTLKVEDEGEYEWYDVAEGGTPLHTGSTYTTTITADKTFYVQDAGAMDIVVGPAKKSLSGGNKWSNLPVKFSTNKACSISGFTMLISSHSDGKTNVEVELESNGGKKTTFMSDPVDVKGDDQFVDVTFPEPIDIPGEGEYVLTVKNSSFVIHYLQTMTDFSSFAHQGDPITFLGIAEKDRTGILAIADWKVTTGSGCARAVVKAKMGNSSSTELVQDNLVYGLYPNPVEDVLTIELPLNANATVEVVNVLGNVVLSSEVSASDNELNMGALPKGIYLVRISNGEAVHTERIIKE